MVSTLVLLFAEVDRWIVSYPPVLPCTSMDCVDTALCQLRMNQSSNVVIEQLPLADSVLSRSC